MELSSPDLFINDMQPDTPLSSVGAEDEESVDNSSPDSSVSPCRPERRKQRRNPAVLVEWIEDHPFNPYPTKQEKQQLAALSGMTLRQLNDWFANARRNIKKLGYEIWRKKRNGVHNQKMFSKPPPVSSAPPNVVADINDLGRRLSSPQYTNMSAVPLYGSTVGPGGCELQPRSLSHSQTPYARLNCNSAALFPPLTAGWFTPTRPLFRPSPYTVPPPSNHDCTCSVCKPTTQVFNMPVQSTTKFTGIPSLTSIPWSSENNNQFSYVDGQGEDAWSSNGSPESCPDIADLSLPVPPSSNVGVSMIKEELVSSSNCCGLSGTNGVS